MRRDYDVRCGEVVRGAANLEEYKTTSQYSDRWKVFSSQISGTRILPSRPEPCVYRFCLAQGSRRTSGPGAAAGNECHGSFFSLLRRWGNRQQRSWYSFSEQEWRDLLGACG